jgi:hypothetical protein
VPSLSHNSLAHQLHQLHHSTRSSNIVNSSPNISFHDRCDLTATSNGNGNHNSNHIDNTSQNADALQWLRHSYDSDSSPYIAAAGTERTGFGKFEADEDEEEDHFLAHLARKKSLSATAHPSIMSSTQTVSPPTLSHSTTAGRTSIASASSPTGKLSFCLLRHPSVGNV